MDVDCKRQAEKREAEKKERGREERRELGLGSKCVMREGEQVLQYLRCLRRSARR